MESLRSHRDDDPVDPLNTSPVRPHHDWAPDRQHSRIRPQRRAACRLESPVRSSLQATAFAEGNHQRDELTADRFPSRSVSAGRRMARTGDVGRWSNDGRPRTSPGAPTTRSRFVASVSNSARSNRHSWRTGHQARCRLTRDAGGGDVRLVAHLIFEPDEDPTVSDVRRHLRQTLPDYMIPAAVVVRIDETPLLPERQSSIVPRLPIRLPVRRMPAPTTWPRLPGNGTHVGDHLA